MKKKIISVAIVCTTIFSMNFLQSCNDALDIVQPGELSDDNTFNSVGDMNSYLLGAVYGTLDTNNEIYLTSVITDEVKPGNGSGGQEFQLHRLFLDSGNPLAGSIWLGHYTTINRVNRLLRGAEKIIPSNDNQNQYNSIIAQARAIRAFCYLELETYFSEDMKDDNKLGVILLKDVPVLEAKLPRSANKDIYALMNEDLDFAASVMTTNGSSQFYVDRNFVNALRARFNLYRGKMDLAKQYANLVITQSGLTLTPATPAFNPSSPIIDVIPSNPPAQSGDWLSQFYAISNSLNPYRNIWDDKSNFRGEIVFSIGRLAAAGNGTAIGARYNLNNSSAAGTPMWYMGRNLFNIVYNTPGDIRKYAFIDPSRVIDINYMNSSSPISSDKLIIDKYPGKTGSNTRNDIKVFRLSEMYFILAECAVNDNQFSIAAGYIKQVRDARNYLAPVTVPTYINATAAYADILKERRVELFLEGHRYIDLKRLAVAAGVSMDRNPTDDIVSVSNLPNGSYKYTLPIPLEEISGNANIQQNTGY